MGHTEYCSLPTTEDRPAYSRIVVKTGDNLFSQTGADVELDFEPLEYHITAYLNPVDVSYDGRRVHATLNPGQTLTWRGTKRHRFWFRERSDADAMKATKVAIDASANENVGHH